MRIHRIGVVVSNLDETLVAPDVTHDDVVESVYDPVQDNHLHFVHLPAKGLWLEFVQPVSGRAGTARCAELELPSRPPRSSRRSSGRGPFRPRRSAREADRGRRRLLSAPGMIGRTPMQVDSYGAFVFMVCGTAVRRGRAEHVASLVGRLPPAVGIRGGLR